MTVEASSGDTGVWRQARELFDRAVDLPAEERKALLAAECAGNEVLLRAVKDLLAADAMEGDLEEALPSGDLLEALEDERDRRWLGAELGPWRLLERIGHGGMGSVFLAERADRAFEKRVAVKLLPLWMSRHEDRRRFERERQILAALEHPHIARLLDGGTSEEGMPYLVMEYVEGLPLTEYCDHHRLSLEERIDLLRRVAETVAFAHQNLVVHRDLKAANILVTENGEPRLLDFGIAKLLEGSEILGGMATTRTRGDFLTLGYASPEQITGEPITTASDVYSLGVLLYELLLGRRPFDWQGRSPGDIENTLRTSAPAAPSDVVRGRREVPGTLDPEALAARLQLRPGTLARRLKGDLDNIVLRTLRFEPSKRYASAQELGDDLYRLRHGLPVRARSAGRVYKVRKWVGRNAVLTTALLALMVFLLGFGVLSWRQNQRLAAERDIALREKARAELVAQFLVDSFEQADPNRNRGEQLTAREILESGARQVSRELEGEPELEAELLVVLGRVHVRLGLYEQARPLLERALELRQKHLPRDHLSIAESLHEWAELLHDEGEFDEAEKTARQAVALRRTRNPQKAAQSLHLLARIRRAQDAREESITLHKQALEIQRLHLGNEHPEVVHGLVLLARGLRFRGLREPAAEILEEALTIQERLFPGDHPDTGRLLVEISRLLKVNSRLAEAEIRAERALSMNRRLFGNVHPSVSSALNALASIHRELGEFEEAGELYQESLDLERRLLGTENLRFAIALYNQAYFLHLSLGRPAEAVPLFEEALEIAIRTVGEEHVNAGFFGAGLGGALVDLGRAHEAEPLLRQALDLFERQSSGGSTGRNANWARSELAGALLHQGRQQEAKALLRKALPVLEEDLGAEHEIVKRTRQRVESF